MRLSNQIIVVALGCAGLLSIGCGETIDELPAPDASADTARKGQVGAECPGLTPPEPGDLLTEDDVQRIAELPYYASLVLDLPIGEERLGAAQLVVHEDGRRGLSLVSSSEGLGQTVSIDLDLTQSLSAQDGVMTAEQDNSETPFGSIHIDGEGGTTYLTGAIEWATF